MVKVSQPDDVVKPAVEQISQSSAPAKARLIDIPRSLSVRQLADLLQVDSIQVIKQLMRNDIMVETLPKINEGRPNIIDYIKDNKVSLVINTPSGKATKEDETQIRSNAILYGIPLITTISGAQASVNGIENMIRKPRMSVKSLQKYHKEIK